MLKNKKLNRVLIANRGEIAMRIARAAHELGIETVSVYAEEDKSSAHRFFSTLSVNLKGTTLAETYLNRDVLIKIAKATDCDAVHPGYGFLSENALFAEAVESSDLVFVGPTSSAIRSMGDKITSRKIMKQAGVPIVPGTVEGLSAWADVKSIVDEIGYPVILKATAGGGGRGMRIITQESELKESYETCRREAGKAFGNDQLFCERYVSTSRHIEVQILFDHYGHGVHLFERDCTLQRKHQKLMEESPSPVLSEDDRERFYKYALEAARAVNYRNAGTVEFIYEGPGKFYFLEMNTRIQVEHPVTEMVTGIDLVKEQFKISQGEALSFRQENLSLRGHAIEFRINTEDPYRGFLPSGGVVGKYQAPGGPFVRFDSHYYAGYEIPGSFDSLAGKLICWGKNREEAIQRSLRALQELCIEDVSTTASLFIWLLQQPEIRSSDFHSRYLETALKKFQDTTTDLTEDEKMILTAAAHVGRQQRSLSEGASGL